MLVVQFAKAFLLAESVELGGEDAGGALVGGPGELGVELQGGGAPRVPEAPGDGVQAGARGQELGGGVPPVPVRHRVGVPRRAARRVRGEREGVFGHPDAEGPRPPILVFDFFLLPGIVYRNRTDVLRIWCRCWR